MIRKAFMYMKNSNCLLAILFLVVLTSCQNTPVDDKLKDEKDKLKKLGFCKCLYASNPNSDFWKNEGSGEGYFQTSNFSIEAATTVRQYAREFSKKEYRSYGDRDLYVMKCLDFYHSKELDSLVNTLITE